jgi:Mg/Co/Ni transporter MgtE
MEDRPSVWRFLTNGAVLRRNLTIALIVGSILSTVNQLEFIIAGNLTPRVLAKVLFNYLVPFTVASVSSCLNRQEK